MVNRPSVPEIITVNSETLQTQIRDLLPSQNGFGSELQATNVITPIIDLTASASGSAGLASELQNALAFGSQTNFSVSNGNTDLASSPGFYRVTGTASFISVSTAEHARINLIDATPTTKIVWELGTPSGKGNSQQFVLYDYVFWLATGEKINVECSLRGVINGSFRQIADSTGTVVNPSGYPL